MKPFAMRLLFAATCLFIWGWAEGPAPLAPVPQSSQKLDALVKAAQAKRKTKPAARCPDEVFIRRAYLDLTGTLPTLAETRKFLESDDANRRIDLVDRLLASEEHAGYRTMKWCDLLRVKSEFPVNLWPNAVQAYARWIFESMRDNKPHDVFARELLTSTGGNFREAPVNFMRAVRKKDAANLAEVTALNLFGMRYDAMPKDRQNGLAAFFYGVAYKATGEWKEEIVYFDPDRPPLKDAASNVIPPLFPDGTPATIPPGVDGRKVLSDWMLRKENPLFRKAMANRVWFWLMGRGLIHEPDDIRADNPCAAPEVLDYLAAQFLELRYDVRALERLIVLSETWQASSLPVPKADDPLRYQVRRMEAEVLLDAIDRLLGATESYSSQIPEPFTWIPPKNRSVELFDGSISSATLELFGRPARDTGRETERNNSLTPSQKLFMLNSTEVQDKIRNSAALRKVLQAAGQGAGANPMVETLYLYFLNRYPTDADLANALDHIKAKTRKPAESFADLAWVILNSTEFLMKH